MPRQHKSRSQTPNDTAPTSPYEPPTTRILELWSRPVQPRSSAPRTRRLPALVELFEARKPRETAVISEIDGLVRHGGVVKGQRKILIVPEDGGEPREYSLPRGVHVNVQEGDRVRAGEPLMDGPSNPHDILSVLGEKALHAYLVNEIQEVYRLQGVNINDKHIEVIVRQMMRWVKIEDVGDTEFLIEEQVDRFRSMEENERVIANGGRPATGRPLLLGITKASLSTDSFISRRRYSGRGAPPPRARSRLRPRVGRRRSRKRRACSPKRRFRARWITCAA